MREKHERKRSHSHDTMTSLIEVHALKKLYRQRTPSLNPFSSSLIPAVDTVSFAIEKGEILGLVGESGCGKTTLGKLLIGIERPTDGKVLFNGKSIARLHGRKLRKFRRHIQMVFQNPFDSLDPRYKIGSVVTEPLKIHYKMTASERRQRASEVLDMCGLNPDDLMRKYPHALSGGERQRISIVRAIITSPEFIVADEPVSMLDVSVRATVLRLLVSLRDEQGISFLYITHDIATARYICNRLGIMYLGEFVELGAVRDVLNSPRHPYTKTLISAVPEPDPQFRSDVRGLREIAEESVIPDICRFYPRCFARREDCKKRGRPELRVVSSEHEVACYTE